MKKFIYLTSYLFFFVISCGTELSTDARQDISWLDQANQFTTTKDLPLNKNLDISSPTAEGGNLSSVFKGHHLVIDLSSSDCSGCVAFAINLQYDKEAQNWFNGEHCSFISLVDSQDLDKWLKKFHDESYATKHSYGIYEGIFAASNAFGFEFEQLPGFMIIDRDGNLTVSAAGGLPEDTARICSN